MRIAKTVAGVLAVLIGGVWMLQGFNVLPGSFMTGDTTWAAIGAMAMSAGLTLIIWTWRDKFNKQP
jgi:hypothetical protein